jgi:acyl-coenzyme A synthetase/AMP-(fatty) acid ligase
VTAPLAQLVLGEPPPGAPPELVITPSATTSRADLVTSVEQLAALLAGAGCEPGARVAALLPTDATAVAAMFGVWAAGAVYIPVNPRLHDEEIGRILADVAPTVVIGKGRDIEPDGLAWRLTGDVTLGRDVLDPDVALILYTSGTTGRPKPVQLRHAATIEGIDAVLAKIRGGGAPRQDAPPKRRQPNLVPFSLSLWSGIYNTCFAFRVGSPVILLDPFEPQAFARLVREHHLTSTVLAPAMVAMVTDDTEIDNLAPLRFVRSITAPLSPLQARRFHDRYGVAVLNSYGQTELGGEVIGWNAADVAEFGETKLGAIGRPHDGIELRFLDDGELCVRSPYMMKGYLDADAEVRLTDDGYLRTGDIGHIDEDGFVWLSGRVSDVINRGGLKVFPTDVEEVLLLHPDVRDAAVVGVADERLGEVPWAFVVAPRHEAGEDAELAGALGALCREHLAPFRVPVHFVVVDALPRNEVGKVLRRELAGR